jgi:hypothetical protein
LERLKTSREHRPSSFFTTRAGVITLVMRAGLVLEVRAPLRGDRRSGRNMGVDPQAQKDFGLRPNQRNYSRDFPVIPENLALADFFGRVTAVYLEMFDTLEMRSRVCVSSSKRETPRKTTSDAAEGAWGA